MVSYVVLPILAVTLLVMLRLQFRWHWYPFQYLYFLRFPLLSAIFLVFLWTIGISIDLWGKPRVSPGPFFNLYLNDIANPCSQGSQPANLNQSGIVFFPGSLPLYKNGVLVGGLGVSGDGVDQDDYVTFHGAQGFLPPANIQADNYSINGVRMPYLKFPRNPEQ